MKQSINFLKATPSIFRLSALTMGVAIWLLAVICMISWAGLQKNKLQHANEQLKIVQSHNQSTKNKISVLGHKTISSIRKSDQEIAIDSSAVQLSLTGALNKIVENYVQGTTIDYIHIQQNQSMLIEGRALHSGLVTNIVEKLNSSGESTLKIKVKSMGAKTQHVVFSIATE